MDKWENIRVRKSLMSDIKRFASMHEMKYSDLASEAIEDYMKKVDAENLTSMIRMLRDDYSDKMDAFTTLGIKNFDEYMRHIIFKTEGNMNKILSDKIDEITQYIQDTRKRQDGMEKRQDKLEKKKK